MGQALYRKYRSKSLDDVVGQEHVTQTLAEALKQDRISHAYLFTGPRGVGKTSVARIWAHQINNLPYTDESSHIDIIEIDAASNRRIDEIRDLRDKVYVAPTSAKYKVYIIDEVHMLTREAFNALLKTLEEPPAHVVFILATTDAHKLPETIISRTQRFSFKPGEAAKVIDHLRHIAQAEKITISDEALTLIAEHGEGSFRDSVSLLDQASSHGHTVELADVQQLLGLPPAEALGNLLAQTLSGGQPAEIMQALSRLYDQGFQPAMIAKQLGQQLRQDIATNGISDLKAALELLTQLLAVPAAHNPERFLEITLLSALPSSPSAQSMQSGEVVQPKPVPITAKVEEPQSAVHEKTQTIVQQKPQPKESAEPEAEAPKKRPVSVSAFDEAIWPTVLQQLKKRHNTLYGIVRMAQPDFGEGHLTLAFAFPFHQKRLSESTNRKLLTDIIEETTGQVITIECTVDKLAEPPKPTIESPQMPPAASSPADLSTISNIFGGAELLES
jgi:DNA polymerase-3 subunit gamma/tau